jgi:exodeoxyribonuclease VII small subunit
MSKTMQFEQNITQLESIVQLLEKGELSLEESLKQFETGITLARQCEVALKKAEKKVEILSISKTPIDESNTDHE